MRILRACSSVRLERTPDKREVDGSTPSRPTMSRKIEPVRKFIPECGVFEFQDSEQLIGGVAQLGERLPCTQEAIGSSPFTSTIFKF